MITKIVNSIFSTDSLPVAGGSVGALVGSDILEHLPTHELVITTITLASIGAIVGYVIKVILDKIFKKK